MADVTTLISYTGTSTAPAGVLVRGTTAMASVKIKENKTSQNCIQLKNGYNASGVYNGNAIILKVDGGFKAGDVLSVTGFFNNTDDSKVAKAELFTIDAENNTTVVWTSEQFINGRTSAETPTAQTYTLESDMDSICIGRNGGTGTNLMAISVTREFAKTQYAKPEITIGAFDYVNWSYSVTLTASENDGLIDYQIGEGAKVENVTSGTQVTVPVATQILATVHGVSFNKSDEASKTTAAAPSIPVPTYEISDYDFATGKYTVTIKPGAEGLRIRYYDGSRYPWYATPLVVSPGSKIEQVRTVHLTDNNTYSSAITINVPAAPSDGISSTPTKASTYTNNTPYDLGAITIPGVCIAGQISSSSTPVNGSIKTRCNQALTEGTGFYVTVNPNYVISSIKIEGCTNSGTANTCTAVYVDGEEVDGFSSVTLPLAAQNGTTETILVNNIAAAEKIEFVFDNTSQGQMNITVEYKRPVYNASLTPDGYGTMYYEKELVCPAGTKAYTGSLSDNTLTLTELPNGIIPANTPAIIMGNGGIFTLGTSKAAAVVSDLKGTATALATSSITEGTVCVLGYANETAGFYRYEGTNLGANKAYLVVPASTPAKISFKFADDATAVDAVAEVKAEAKAVKFIEGGKLYIKTANGVVNAAGAQVK